MVNVPLADSLKRLRLSGLAESLDVRLQEAASNRLDHLEFPELILQDELAVRRQRLINRRTKAASFRDQKTLEDFDWDFNRSIKRKRIFDLAAGGFLRERKDVLLVGPPGTGKPRPTQYPACHPGMRRAHHGHGPDAPVIREEPEACWHCQLAWPRAALPG